MMVRMKVEISGWVLKQWVEEIIIWCSLCGSLRLLNRTVLKIAVIPFLFIPHILIYILSSTLLLLAFHHTPLIPSFFSCLHSSNNPSTFSSLHSRLFISLLRTSELLYDFFSFFTFVVSSLLHVLPAAFQQLHSVLFWVHVL